VTQLAIATTCDILVFGGTGDLSLHKLLPALYHLHAEDRLPADTRIFCVARRELDEEAFQSLVEDRCRPHIAAAYWNEGAWKSYLARLDYVQVDVSESRDMDRLAARLAHSEGRVMVHYLATAPDLFVPIAQNLARVGLAGPESRIVLEKPLGHSLESAQEINAAIGEVFEESRIFRIDHYLGKETVQNLMALRFANLLFEPTWRAGFVDHVQITVNETLGVETRGGYYDPSGAMRDMVQNHLLQVLCLVAMEPPVRYDADSVRNEKLKVLEALVPIEGPDTYDKTVRGQYVEGQLGDKQVPAYRDEEDVAPASTTETYVAIQAGIQNWRWSGVPFYLRTGKRMARKTSEILIQFKPVPHHLFGAEEHPNQLLISIQPEERISVQMMAKQPGKGMSLGPVDFDLNLADAFSQGRRRWEAYERLLLDVIEGDSKLFMRRDEVEAAWRWVDPIIEGWKQHYQQPHSYPAGSSGPEQAALLLERNGHVWHN
jgi:glucose-6-phosphate 1-dehydrogenase